MFSVRIVLVVLAFVYWNFPVYLSVVPQWVNQIVYNGFPLMYLFFRRKELIGILQGLAKFKYCIYTLVCMNFAVIWAFITIVYNNTNDWSYFFKIFTVLRNVYVYIFLLILAGYALPRKDTLESFGLFWGAAVTFCVLFTIFTLLLPDFRSSWQQLVTSTQRVEELTDMAEYVTRFSINGFAGYGQTIVCSISAMFSLLLISKGYRLGILFFVSAIVGNLFYGRIGVIMSCVSVVFLLLKNLSIKRTSIYIASIIGLLIAFNMIFDLLDNPLLDAWKLWLMQPIEAFTTGLQYGQLSFGSSGDKLSKEMYFMPDESTFIWGDGRYTNNDESYYMRTDAGYMRIILYFGIVGASLVYLSYFLLFLQAKSLSKDNMLIKYSCEILLILLFIEEYKGDGYGLFFGLMFVLIAGSLWRRNKENAKY